MFEMIVSGVTVKVLRETNLKTENALDSLLSLFLLREKNKEESKNNIQENKEE